MWPREAGIRPYEQGNEDKIIKAPWQEGAVVSPGTGWFHQHFGTGSADQKPVRQLALRPSGGQNPVGFRRTVSREGPAASIRKGGSLVDFDLEDPRVRQDFKAELATKGLPLSDASRAGTVGKLKEAKSIPLLHLPRFRGEKRGVYDFGRMKMK
jgi:hypothetical protein